MRLFLSMFRRRKSVTSMACRVGESWQSSWLSKNFVSSLLARIHSARSLWWLENGNYVNNGVIELHITVLRTLAAGGQSRSVRETTTGVWQSGTDLQA